MQQAVTFTNRSGYSTDEMLITSWLAHRPLTTQEVYLHTVGEFRYFLAGLSLADIFPAHIESYAEKISALSVRTQHKKLSAIKSLFSYAHKVGYLPLNAGATIRLPKIENDLGKRYLSEEEVIRMIALENNARNHFFLRFLYHTGMRISEVCSLRWCDAVDRPDLGGGQFTFLGKGKKTRTVVCQPSFWQELLTWKNMYPTRGGSDYIFFTQKKNSLDRRTGWRIVKRAVLRAGITRPVSPHWFRHAHAGHALKRKADMSLVAKTLGHSNLNMTNLYNDLAPSSSSSSYLVL